MDADLSQSKAFLTLWAWADKNKKQLMWGLIALVVVGLGVAFWLAHQSETQNDANDALSRLTSPAVLPGGSRPTPDSLLKITADYSGTEAAQRAQLLAAADFFTAGKYDDAQAQFQKFIRDFSDSKLISQAAFGVAVSYDAMGKTSDAMAAYQSVIDRYPNDNVAVQAKLALGRLQEAQGKFKEAKANFEEVARTTGNADAIMRYQQLMAAHPELNPPPAPATPAAPVAPATHVVPAAPVIKQQPTTNSH